MLETYFNLNYIFGKEDTWSFIDNAIAEGTKGYINVADGVVLNMAQRDLKYRETVNGALFCMCDSSWVPVYLNKIYGIKRVQYSGPMLFHDSILRRKHRLFFMGTNQSTLDGLKKEMSLENPDLQDMQFYELPFLPVEKFDYPAIAKMVNEDGADIIFVALGAPKQDYFMQNLLPYLNKGIMVGVGAAFNFYSGTGGEKYAPLWIRQHHLEFVYRIFQNPKKQLNRCWWIIRTMPSMISEEKGKKRQADKLQKALNGMLDAINTNNPKKWVKYRSTVLNTEVINNDYWEFVIPLAGMILGHMDLREIKDEELYRKLEGMMGGI